MGDYFELGYLTKQNLGCQCSYSASLVVGKVWIKPLYEYKVHCLFIRITGAPVLNLKEEMQKSISALIGT